MRRMESAIVKSMKVGAVFFAIVLLLCLVALPVVAQQKPASSIPHFSHTAFTRTLGGEPS